MANKPKKTLVLGASTNPTRYSYLAINRLLHFGHKVVAMGSKPGNVQGIEIETAPKPIESLDTVTLYLNAHNQKPYYDYILSLNPKRVIFNPGAENDDFSDLLQAKGIQVMEACTLVLLSTGQY